MGAVGISGSNATVEGPLERTEQARQHVFKPYWRLDVVFLLLDEALF